MSELYIPGTLCTPINYGIDFDARPFINQVCRINKRTKAGLIQVMLERDHKKMYSFAQRDIDLSPPMMQMYNVPRHLLQQPAQFIYQDNNHNEVIGFIKDVHTDVATFLLFEPRPAIPQVQILRRGGISIQECMHFLEVAVAANPIMREEWIKLKENAYE